MCSRVVCLAALVGFALAAPAAHAEPTPWQRQCEAQLVAVQGTLRAAKSPLADGKVVFDHLTDDSVSPPRTIPTLYYTVVIGAHEYRVGAEAIRWYGDPAEWQPKRQPLMISSWTWEHIGGKKHRAFLTALGSSASGAPTTPRWTTQFRAAFRQAIETCIRLGDAAN